MPVWYNTSWLYRLPVTVDNTANTTSALAWHQVSVALTGAAYTSFHAHALSSGADIVVTDSDGITPLNFALESIDTTNSVVYLLVKVPLVAAASTQTIYVYYGNAGASSASSYANTVGPATAATGPTDIFTQTDAVNLNNNSVIVRLRYQDQVHGGGVGLNGEVHCYINNQLANAGAANCTIWQIRSTDGGVTFPTKTNILIPAASHAASVQTVLELADGTILLFYQYDLTSNYTGAKEQGYVAKSVDGGRTWTNLSTSPSNPMTVPSGYTSAGLPYGPPIQQPNGDLLKTWYGVKTGNSITGSYLLKCANGSDPTNGSNWTLQGTIAYDGTNAYSETCVFWGGISTKLIAVMRNDSIGTQDMYTCTSSDSGATWGAVTAMGVPGVASHGQAISPFPLILADGVILLFYGVRGYGTNNGFAWLSSTDNGVNWLDRSPINPTTYGILGDCGYPGADFLANGNIVAAAYHEVGGNIDTANIVRLVFTEDYALNANNVYEGCESLSAWSSVGAQVTVDTGHVHNGTNALKFDNSAGTGISATRVIWPIDTALAARRIAYSFWRYATQNAGNYGCSPRDATPTNRVSSYVDGTGATQHVEVYTGAGYTDSGVAASLNKWNKTTVHADVQASSVAGGHVLLNDSVLTPTPGKVNNGTAPQSLAFSSGNSGSTTLTTTWLDDVYTHQYTANIPTFTVGTEQPFTGPTTATLSGPTSGSVGVPSSNFTITLDQPAPSGGVSCVVSDSVGGDTVTPDPIVIPLNSVSGTFTITPSSNGNRTITLSSTTPTLTIAGSPITYNAGASPPTAAPAITVLGMGVY